MNDKELLEKAAKAAGWTGWRSKHGYWNVESPEGEKSTHCHHWSAYCSNTGEKLKEPTFADAIADTNWNPLTDDGDALRLAVKLRLTISWDCFNDDDYATATPPHTHQGYDCMVDKDSYAAARRAIVRAAAEIGKEMK